MSKREADLHARDQVRLDIMRRACDPMRRGMS
jgi:hypothetical protein